MVFPWPEPGVWPGIERAAGELARALAKEGAQVTVLTTYWNGGHDGDLWEGIRIRRVTDATRSWGKAGYLFSWNVRSFSRRVLHHPEILRDSDVLHAFVGLSGPERYKALGRPLFVSFPHRERPRGLTDRMALAGRFGIDRRCLRAADGVFAGSSVARDVLVADYGVDPARTHVVPLGVDGETFRPASRPSDPVPEGSDGIRLLYAGPLIRRKGLSTLIEALPFLKRRSIPFHLLLVGEGPELQPLREQAASLGVGGAIEFAGFVKESRLVEAYRGADVFVFPSLLEGFGLVLVEAMACGLPVVANAIAPMTEVVGDAGLLVPPSDPGALGEALARLAADPDLRAALAGRARRRVEDRFLWRRVALQTLEHYERARRRREPAP